jgi:periplasmic protein TonB
MEREMEDRIVLINNNDYGAAELKKTYQRSFREGLLIAVLVHVAVIFLYIAITYINNARADDKKIILNKPGVFVDLDIPPPIDNTEPPKVKEDDILKPQKDLSALQPDPVAKSISDNVITKTQDELQQVQNNVSDKGDSVNYFANNNNIGDIKVKDDVIKDKIDNVVKNDTRDVIFENFQVEVAPECTNLQQVRGSITYPPVAVEIGLEGKVTVRVLVGEDGSVLKVGNINGNDVFREEVKEKSKNLVFTPGLQNNKAVKVWVSVPFSFKLKN